MTAVLDTRHRLGLTQIEFAALLGVHPLTVSKWERGALEPSSYFEALIAVFDRAWHRNRFVGGTVSRLIASHGAIVALTELLAEGRE